MRECVDNKGIIGLLIIIANLILFGLGLKLYTEFFKERVKGKTDGNKS